MLLREVEYARPATVEEAISVLGSYDGARPLAGGQTLVNVMKARAASPDVLVDLNRLDDLRTIKVSGDTLQLGAMATYTQIMSSSEVEVSRPILAEVAAQIADVQVRNRGTIGGNVCSNDPTNHLPPLLVALGASFTIRGADGEILTEVRLPALDGYGFGYHKFNRRREDWAMVAVSALVKKAPDGSCDDVRIGLTHLGSVPLRATAAEQALRGQPLDAQHIAAAAEHAADGTEPPADLNASADYKRHLARVLCRRAIEDASL